MKKVFIYSLLGPGEGVRYIGKSINPERRFTNTTDGGEGITGHHHSNQARLKIGLGQRGKIVSEETRRKQSEAAKNRSSEARANIAASNKNPSAEKRDKSNLFKRSAVCQNA